MSKAKRCVVSGIVCIALFVIIALLCILGLFKLQGALPKCTELYNENGIGITLGQLFEMKTSSQSPSLEVLGISLPVDGTISTEGRNTASARAFYATPTISRLVPFELVSGSWALDWSNSTKHFAVIPEELSISLFATNAPLGVTVQFNGIDYGVVGVYREGSGPIADLSGDGVTSVYLIGGQEAYEAPAVLVYMTDRLERDAATLGQMIAGSVRAYVYGDETDYRTLSRLVQSLLFVELFVCAFFLATQLFVTGGTLITAVHAGKWGDSTRRGILRIVLGSAIILLTIFGLALMADTLNIPSAVLPPENIFDFSHYCREIAGFFHKVNARAIAGYTLRYFRMYACLLLTLGAAGIVLFACGVFKLFVTLRVKLCEHLNKPDKYPR